MKICLHLWDEEKPCFSMPFFLFYKADSWYHEFNEFAVWCFLRNYCFTILSLNTPIVLKLNNGEKRKQLVSHIVVSLHDDSYMQVYEDKLNHSSWISPDDYASLILKNINNRNI